MSRDAASPHPARTAAPPGKPRIALVTNGHYFANLALEPLLADTADHWEWQVIVTTGLRRPRRNQLTETLRLFGTWGWRYTAYKILTYAWPLLLQLVSRRTFFVGATCRRLGMRVVRLRNVNRPESVAVIAAFRPDIVLSFSCPYRIETSVLSLSRVGNMNVHASLLPKYAGIGAYVHVLAHGESVTGVTVHEMIHEFDAGPIVAQRPLAISPGESMFELFARQCREATSLLRAAIDLCLEAGRVVGTEQDLTRRTYFGEPNRRDVEALRTRGHRLMTPGDARRIWRLSRPGGRV